MNVLENATVSKVTRIDFNTVAIIIDMTDNPYITPESAGMAMKEYANRYPRLTAWRIEYFPQTMCLVITATGSIDWTRL